MKTIGKLTTLLLLLIAVSSCVKQDDFALATPQRVKVGVVTTDFGSTVITSRSETISTERERVVNNGKVLVFARSGSSYKNLLEIQDIENGVATLSIRESEDVAILAIANYDNAILQTIYDSAIVDRDTGEPEADYTYTQFKTDINSMQYTAKNDVLKNSDNSYLPMISDPIEQSGITDSTFVTLKLEFAYARVDVDITDPDVDYTIESVEALGVPATPNSSNTVTGHKNNGQDFYYLYPKSFTESYPLYLILEVNTADGLKYYKLLFRYQENDSYKYNIEASKRYKINIVDVRNEGYSSRADAVKFPAANIGYDITIDDHSNYIVSTGSYYLGVRETEVTVTSSGSGSGNFMRDGSYSTSVEFSNPTRMNIDQADGGYYFDLIFAYGRTTDIRFDLSDLNPTITLPDGVIYNAVAPSGYNTKDNWNTDTSGERKIRLAITKPLTKSGSDIVIKIGALEQTITIKETTEASAITHPSVDYSDPATVTAMTGFSDNGRPATEDISPLLVSNSYILKPDQNIYTTYYIPVVDRVKEFWGDKGYKNNPDYVIQEADWTENADFEVELLWKDGLDSCYPSASKARSESSNSNVIKIDVPPCCKQNAVVCVKYQGTIIWSWHLWMTDYNPYWNGSDRPVGDDEKAGTAYAVTVNGGELHHYQTSSNDADNITYGDKDVWSSGGIYAAKLIMDRNIGAMSTDPYTSGGDYYSKGTIYYQFGRKDPFPGNEARYASTGERFPYSSNYLDKVENISGEEALTKAPMTFTKTKVFSDYSNAKYDTTESNKNILWNDPKISANKTISDTYGKKSIFDPSPLGFKVPVIGTFDRFNDEYSYPNYPVFNYSVYGRIYSDEGINAYFPIAGYRYWGMSGDLRNSYGFCWSATPDGSEEGYSLYYSGSSVYPSNCTSNSERVNGCTVRPVQE